MSPRAVAERLGVPIGEGDRTVAAVLAAGIVLGFLAIVVAALPPGYPAFGALAVVVPLVALVVGDTRRVLLAIVVVDVPLQIDRYLSVRPDALELGANPGLSISVTTAAIVGLWALRLGEARSAGAPARWKGAAATVLPLATYVAVVALSALVARDVELATFTIAAAVESLLLFAYLATSLRTRSDVLFVVVVMLVGLGLEGLLALALLAGSDPLQMVGDGWGGGSRVVEDGFTRIGGTLPSPTIAASYLSALLVPALALLAAPLGRGYRALAAVAFMLGAIALVLTFSRGGWLAFAVSLGLFGLMAVRRGWRRPRIPLVVAACALVVALPFGGLVVERATGDDQGAAASRVPLMQTALRMSSDHPLVGVGANNYTAAVGDYRTAEVARTWNYTVHNRYLLTLAETGVVGLFALTWFLVAVVRIGAKASGIRDPVLSVVAGGVVAALAGQLVHMAFEAYDHRSSTQGFLVLAAVATAIAVMGDDRRPDAEAGPGEAQPKAAALRPRGPHGAPGGGGGAAPWPSP